MPLCVCVFACGYGICIDDLRRSSLFALEPQRYSLFSSLSYHFVANFSDIALIAMQKVW